MPRQDGARQLFGGGRGELQSACITGQAGAGAGCVGREVAGLQRRAAGRPAASPPVQPLSSLPPQARAGVAAPAAAAAGQPAGPRAPAPRGSASTCGGCSLQPWTRRAARAGPAQGAVRSAGPTAGRLGVKGTHSGVLFFGPREGGGVRA